MMYFQLLHFRQKQAKTDQNWSKTDQNWPFVTFPPEHLPFDIPCCVYWRPGHTFWPWSWFDIFRVMIILSLVGMIRGRSGRVWKRNLTFMFSHPRRSGASNSVAVPTNSLVNYKRSLITPSSCNEFIQIEIFSLTGRMYGTDKIDRKT